MNENLINKDKLSNYSLYEWETRPMYEIGLFKVGKRLDKLGIKYIYKVLHNKNQNSKLYKIIIISNLQTMIDLSDWLDLWEI